MVNLRWMQIVVCLFVVDLAISAISSNMTGVDNALEKVEKVEKVEKGLRFRRRGGEKKHHRSTSSSSTSKKGKSSSASTDGESLALSDSSSSSSASNSTSGDKKKEKKGSHRPKSTEERTGWRKWHRKCHKCPEDMVMKWRDPRIKWICGAYQRARRSFKSLCMMHYRNCQDGTMFIKIADHRCQNDTYKSPLPHGEHFFYDYPAKLSMDSTSSGSTASSDLSDGSSVEESSVSDF